MPIDYMHVGEGIAQRISETSGGGGEDQSARLSLLKTKGGGGGKVPDMLSSELSEPEGHGGGTEVHWCGLGQDSPGVASKSASSVGKKIVLTAACGEGPTILDVELGAISLLECA